VINVGNIDGSVALVLCDAEQDDYPIVYCSEYFERLTGYSSEEVLGRNCRFLQHPPERLHRDKKQKGINDLVKAELREKIADGQEARATLVNYRKDGTEFVNVLTTIPIWWEDENAPGTGRRYIVGFQADGAQAY
jgi:PAS domain S-box-containing protein